MNKMTAAIALVAALSTAACDEKISEEQRSLLMFGFMRNCVPAAEKAAKKQKAVVNLKEATGYCKCVGTIMYQDFTKKDFARLVKSGDKYMTIAQRAALRLVASSCAAKHYTFKPIK